MTLTVLPSLGGRVEQWTYDGRMILSSRDVHPDNWGATYWTSPQADWGWPPVAEVDSAPYHVDVSNPREVRLLSQEASIGERRFRIEKRFTVAPGDCIDAEYRIVNLASSPLAIASWEISRVPPGGLTFFPSGDRVLTPIAPHAELVLAERDGLSFYDHAAFEIGLSRKVHADGREGFLAHALSVGDQPLLLLKLFTDSPAARQAPGEGEVELFANFDGRYVEVEVQGPYETIAPGASSTFSVRTAVIPIAAEIRSDLAALVALARSAAARLR